MSKGFLIGLTGYAEAGKDELADKLSDIGWVKIGFSDVLWNTALAINPILPIYGVIPVRLRWIAKRYGYTRAKKFRAVRRYLQWLGTEVVRQHIGEDVWVTAAMARAESIRDEGANVVITNVRFPNEGIAIQDAGGFIVLVSRDGKGPVNDHASDAGLAFPMAEVEIENNGSIDDLAGRANELHNLAFNRDIYMQQSRANSLKIFNPIEEHEECISLNC